MAGGNEEKLSAHSQPTLNLSKFRKMICSYIDMQHYQTALYWADKLASISNDAEDIYCLAQCLFLTKQYHRAAHCIRSRHLDDVYLSCRYLAARCHYESKEYQEAIDILDQNHFRKNLSKSHDDSLNNYKYDVPGNLPVRNLESSLCLLRGKIYEAMDNRGLAAENFQEALHLDIYCYEAFDALIHHQMLSAQEEKDLLESLPFNKQCSEDEAQIVKFLYENKLKKYDKPSNGLVPVTVDHLAGNMDVNVNLAERSYYNCNYQDCFKITSDVLTKDPFHSECLPIHIACLVELNKSNALFYLAHKLVDLYPQNAVAWFAVGCYYLLIDKNDPARRYLSKATTLDRVFGPAWLAYGHSFAVENEHDQAMAAYFKASQLMKGCHLPLLYIGLEYGLTNNSKLAERFFTQALTVAPEDPFVLHEMGVIAFQNKDWVASEKYYKEALQKVQAVHHTVLTDKWEPLLNNLGHTCRKLKKYPEALSYHQQALLLSPQNPSTFSAIGYVHALMGNNALAVDYFHKALGIRRDDTFSTTMLGHVIEQLMNEMPPCEGVVEVPVFEFPSELNVLPVKNETPAINMSVVESETTTSDSMAIEVEMEDNF